MWSVVLSVDIWYGINHRVMYEAVCFLSTDAEKILKLEKKKFFVSEQKNETLADVIMLLVDKCLLLALPVEVMYCWPVNTDS